MNHTKFVVSRFENTNGSTSWRVSGRFQDIRIRKNFKTREEAAAEKATLEIRALQAAAGLHSVATLLTADQMREAEAVFRRLVGHPRPLSFYIDFAIANYREPENQKRLSDAVAEYIPGTGGSRVRPYGRGRTIRARWATRQVTINSTHRGQNIWPRKAEAAE